MKAQLGILSLLFAFNAFAELGIGRGVLTGSDQGNLLKDFNNQNRERILRNKHQIVLTFDDGPTAGVTDKVLDVLKKHDVKGTFFVIGNNVSAQPGVMKRLVKEGHLVANHSMSHPNLADLGLFWRKKLKQEVMGAHEVLTPYLENNKRLYFRAPMGAWESKLADYLNKDDVGSKYIGPLLWDVVYFC